MAAPTEPVTDALYPSPEQPRTGPQVVHAAIEEIRYLSGHSVIAAISAQLTEFRAEMDTRLTRIEAEIKSQTVHESTPWEAAVTRWGAALTRYKK